MSSVFDLQLLAGIYSALTACVVAVGMGYFFTWSFLGIRVLRASRAGQSEIRKATAADGWEVFVLIPCLNESRVIAATIHSMLADKMARVIVIDDASDDDTGMIALKAGGDRVTVVRRDLPCARLGKGPALNAGLSVVQTQVLRLGLDPDRVIICVMDADGRLSYDAFSYVLPLFEDSRVGGVQVAVQIRQNGRLITRMQDFEFWGLSAISQFGRQSSATVSLGGNGQFTRLSALCTIGEEPWSRCVTEDLELALELSRIGWRLETTPSAWVTQQAVDRYRLLLRQRARWFQGHMSCIRHVPEIWRSPQLGALAVLEITLYLGVPWLLVLPWSVMFHVGILQTVIIYNQAGVAVLGDDPGVQVLAGVLLYLASFGPNIMAAYLYYIRCRDTEFPIGFSRALALAHGLIIWNYIAYTSCWWALIRLIRKRKAWDKTARSLELSSGELTRAISSGVVPEVPVASTGSPR